MSKTLKKTNLTIKQYAKDIQHLMDLIEKEIMALPDNLRIQRMSAEPNVFVMNFADIGNNLSAEHHDFKKSYQMIVENLRGGDFADIPAKLDNIVKTGRVFHQNHNYYLHQDVIANLKKIIG